MGNRVHIDRLAWEIKKGVPNPRKQYAVLSCGHRVGPISFVWSAGDPIWCEECAGVCRACGSPAAQRRVGLEWGAACDVCVVLPQDMWRAACNALRDRTVVAMCVCCAEPITANQGGVYVNYRHEDPARREDLAHHACVEAESKRG